jgi:hypothetical protein
MLLVLVPVPVTVPLTVPGRTLESPASAFWFGEYSTLAEAPTA